MNNNIQILDRYKKKVNKNPFNEKLIHRYFIESLYFNEVIRAELLPKRLQKKKIQLIIPEDSRNTQKSGYRPDFTIYFKGEEKAYPVEIKWNSKDFNKDNQINYIKQNQGFLVVLKNDRKQIEVDTIEIDISDFQAWLAKNLFNLCHDSLSEKNVLDRPQSSWIVCARGTAKDNFSRMMEATEKHFWAFKNEPKATKEMFRLSKNDAMLFLFFKSPSDKGQSLRKNVKHRDLEITGWAKVKIKEPYYLCLEGEQSMFFELLSQGDSEKISERKWVHFFDFQIQEVNMETSRQISSKGWDDHLLNSSNRGGGILEPIPSAIWNQIYSELLVNNDSLI